MLALPAPSTRKNMLRILVSQIGVPRLDRITDQSLQPVRALYVSYRCGAVVVSPAGCWRTLACRAPRPSCTHSLRRTSFATPRSNCNNATGYDTGLTPGNTNRVWVHEANGELSAAHQEVPYNRCHCHSCIAAPPTAGCDLGAAVVCPPTTVQSRLHSCPWPVQTPSTTWGPTRPRAQRRSCARYW